MRAPFQLIPRPNDQFMWLPSSLSREQILDQLHAMKRAEYRYSRKDYLKLYYQAKSQEGSLEWMLSFSPLQCSTPETTPASHCATVDADYREHLCLLLYEIADFCYFGRETVAFAIWNVFDRYLSTAQPASIEDRDQVQLAALASLLIATKMLEPVNIDIQSLADLARSRGKQPRDAAVRDLLEMEFTILSTLKWNVAHGPTPLAFVQHYLTLLRMDGMEQILAESILEHAQYQVELAVLDYDLVCGSKAAAAKYSSSSPSQVALAAVWNALESSSKATPTLQAWYQERLLDILSTSNMDGFANNITISSIQFRLCTLLHHAQKIGRKGPPTVTDSNMPLMKDDSLPLRSKDDDDEGLEDTETSSLSSSSLHSSSYHSHDSPPPKSLAIPLGSTKDAGDGSTDDADHDMDCWYETSVAKESTTDASAYVPYYKLSYLRKLLLG